MNPLLQLPTLQLTKTKTNINSDGTDENTDITATGITTEIATLNKGKFCLRAKVDTTSLDKKCPTPLPRKGHRDSFCALLIFRDGPPFLIQQLFEMFKFLYQIIADLVDMIANLLCFP
jgi:hypothetical protein